MGGIHGAIVGDTLRVDIQWLTQAARDTLDVDTEPSDAPREPAEPHLATQL